jgi:3-oxoacyl-[acyl-carrier-protein] synthase III
MGAEIKNVAFYVPEKRLSNADLCREFPELKEEVIFRKTGIRNRYILPDGKTATQFASEVVPDFFSKNKIDPRSVDMLLFCSEGFDYRAGVSSALIHDRTGLRTDCGVVDVPHGCSGYSYCLGMAKGFIEGGMANRVMIVNADMATKVIHPADMELRSIFGDAAAITLVDRSVNAGIGEFVFGTDGSGFHHLYVDRSGMFSPVDAEWAKDHSDAGGMLCGRMKMNSLEIFHFSMKVVPGLIADILSKNNLKDEDISLYIFHQANGFMLEKLRYKIGIPQEKFFVNIERYANTVSATIPIALAEALDQKRLKQGDKVLLAGFGIGLTWSGTVITV